MKKRIAAIILSALMMVSLSSCATEAPPEMPERQTETKHERPEPAENYYGYVNFDYLSNGQIPYGETSIGTFDTVGNEMKEYLFKMISRCVENPDPDDPFENTIKELYEQYLDDEAREKAGYDVLLPAIKAIEDSKTPDEYVAALGMVYREYGVTAFMNFEANVNFCDPTEYALCIMNLNTFGNMKENFTKRSNGSEAVGDYVKKALEITGVDPAESKKRAADVARMMQEVMSVSLDSDVLQHLEEHMNFVDSKKLSEIYSNIDAKAMMKSFGFDEEEIVVFDIDQAKKVNEYLTEDNMRMLKDYAFGCIFAEYASVIKDKGNDSAADDKTEEERSEAAMLFVGQTIDREVGIVYGREICTDEIMTSAEKMLDDIKSSCRDLISNSDRLSDDAKKKFTKKLDNIIFMVGYDKNYTSPFQIIPAKDGGDLLTNMVLMKTGKRKRALSQLGQKVDRHTWDMSPIEVNAVYNPSVNSVTIPAVMLSKAIYDPEASEYTNLGMVGYVIAHEMNHAFDEHGFMFDENGAYKPEWLKEEDRTRFREVLDKAIQYYNDYTILDVYHVDGKKTLAENIADIGAVQCLAGIPETKQQLQELFEGIAVQWAGLWQVTDLTIQLEADLHSPKEARVNAVLSSIDRFYEAYDVKTTDKMYVAPENRIKVW